MNDWPDVAPRDCAPVRAVTFDGKRIVWHDQDMKVQIRSEPAVIVIEYVAVTGKFLDEDNDWMTMGKYDLLKETPWVLV